MALSQYTPQTLKAQKYMLDLLAKGKIVEYGKLDEKNVYVNCKNVLIFVMDNHDFLLTNIFSPGDSKKKVIGGWLTALDDTRVTLVYNCTKEFVQDKKRYKVDVYVDNDGNQYYLNNDLMKQFGKPSDLRQVCTTKKAAFQPVAVECFCGLKGIVSPMRHGFIPANKEAK